MAARKQYRPWAPEQSFLLPPSPRDWLPEGHLAWFILEVVDELDLSAITDVIQSKDPRGNQPYNPRMMVALLLYAYCTGRPSSRKIERGTYEDVAFRVIASGQHPDHSTISSFRRQHLSALAGLFLQVLRLCQKAGLVKLGHVALDGTKMKANASRHKAMSYQRMLKAEAELQAEIKALLEQAEAADSEEDARYGANRRGDELPEELRRRTDRLQAIRNAREALEAEAARGRAEKLRAQAAAARNEAEQSDDPAKRKRCLNRAAKREEAAAALAARSRAGQEPAAAPDAESGDDEEPTAVPDTDSGGDEAPDTDSSGDEGPAAALDADSGDDEPGGSPAATSDLPKNRPPTQPDGTPKPTAQRNFTDPDSRIMKKGRDYIQGYNCQTAVDAAHQIIVAQAVTNQAPDAEHFTSVLDQVGANCGRYPDKLSADAGYFSAENIAAAEARNVDPYIAVRRQKKQEQAAPVDGLDPPPDDASLRVRMDAKLRSPDGKEVYKYRKAIVEPVYGQIREPQGFQAFSLRGLAQARDEWSLVCGCHNILKLFRATLAGKANPWRNQLPQPA